MLCRRKIEVSDGTSRLYQPLIRQQTLADQDKADTLLSRARTQADQLLRNAAEKGEEQAENRRRDFLLQANALLSSWERDRQALYDNAEKILTTIANQAIYQVLGEAPPEQRLAALLRQLFAAQVPAVKATLLCHPSEYDALHACLARHHPVPWHLQPDQALQAQTLVLETAEGNFRIEWGVLLETLALPGGTPSQASQSKSWNWM